MIGNGVYGEGVHQVGIELPCVVAVADGVGGNQGGQESSNFVLNYLSNVNLEKISTEDEIKAVLQDCNNALLLEARKNPALGKMATTLTAVIFALDTAYLIQVGNTRLYGMPGNYLKQISMDQTTYQMLLNMGRVEEAEVCRKNEITGCLGGGSSEYARRVEVEKVPEKMLRKLLLLTSDGIHDYISPETIEETMACGDDAVAAQEMIDAANAAGSDDDKTVMIIRF